MPSNPWLLLVAAGLLEIVFAFGLKHASSNRLVLWPITVAAMAGSLWLLSAAMRQLPAGTAYAVWTGIGAVGTAVVGMVVFGEPRTAARVLFIGLIVAGVAGLQGTTASDPSAPEPIDDRAA